MGKRYKKPPVRPEVVRKWLERCEVDGESPPQIAKADGYDVRTVRKQLELMRREREIREARHVVLRAALEQHYVDLCSFAEKLKAGLSGNAPTSISLTLKEDPMWRALHEHLPRLRLWRDIEGWQRLVPEFDKSIEGLKKRIKSEAASQASLEFVSSADKIGLYDGFTDGLVFHLQAVARGWQGLEGIAYKLVNAQNGTRVERGIYTLALVPEDRVKDIQQLFDAMMNETLDWEEYLALKKHTEEFLGIKAATHDELTKIILRRIVPGRCVYCPF